MMFELSSAQWDLFCIFIHSFKTKPRCRHYSIKHIYMELAEKN